MPFISSLRTLRSLSIVGMAKNVGKTETFNYVLRRMRGESFSQVALTSIGLDGERTDQVTQTPKPEIIIPEGYSFVTTHHYYAQRQVVSSVWGLSPNAGPLGRLVFARVQIDGKAILAGPGSSWELKHLIAYLHEQGMKLVIVDGALSRMSLASPSVTEGMILATGAACTPNLAELVKQTAFLVSLIRLPQWPDSALSAQLETLEQGVWVVDGQGQVHDLGIPSVFLLDKAPISFQDYQEPTLYIPGAITDRLFNILRSQKPVPSIIVQDFTRLFIKPLSYHRYVKAGGRIFTLNASKLLGVTLNPYSPQGYHLDSEHARQALSEALELPVYDVRHL